MNEIMKKTYDKSGPKVVEALKKRYFDAYYVSTKEEALAKVLEIIPKEHVVSWGGTMSMAEVGVQKKLAEEGYKVIDRDTAKTPEERVQLMRSSLTCDTFLMSSNAITQDGQLYNIDGAGNRMAALCYGPKSVVIVAGMNKVVKDMDAAISRVRNLAAPANNQRFPNSKTPCSITAECADCLSPDCICAQMVQTRVCKPAGRIKVILVGEDLGL